MGIDEGAFSEERGRSIFNVLKEKAVEDAVEKMRRVFEEQDWKRLGKNRALLERSLEAAWEEVGKEEWKSLPFGLLSEEDARKMIAFELAVDARTMTRKHATVEALRLLEQKKMMMPRPEEK